MTSENVIRKSLSLQSFKMLMIHALPHETLNKIGLIWFQERKENAEAKLHLYFII